MLHFLKNIIQLILSPAKGWEDVSADVRQPAEICRDGLYPLLGLYALTGFLQMIYLPDLTLVKAIEGAIVDFGTYFVSYFLGALIVEQLIGNIVSGEPNRRKVETVSAYAIGLLALIGIIEHCTPTDLMLIKLLPIFVALIIYKADRYLAIKPGDDIRYLFISVVGLVIIPLFLHYTLALII